MTVAGMTRARPRVTDWIKHGLIGGILAGIVFAVFEMVVAAAMHGPDALFMPLRPEAAPSAQKTTIGSPPTSSLTTGCSARNGHRCCRLSGRVCVRRRRSTDRGRPRTPTARDAEGRGDRRAP
jgi:hypothetical protein